MRKLDVYEKFTRLCLRLQLLNVVNFLKLELYFIKSLQNRNGWPRGVGTRFERKPTSLIAFRATGRAAVSWRSAEALRRDRLRSLRQRRRSAHDVPRRRNRFDRPRAAGRPSQGKVALPPLASHTAGRRTRDPRQARAENKPGNAKTESGWMSPTAISLADPSRPVDVR